MKIHVDARRWFQRTYGNTYHTVAVYVDGQLIGTSDRTYGYGTHYLHTAGTILADAGLLVAAVGSEDPYDLHARIAREHGNDLVDTVADVTRRRDLHRAEVQA